MERLIFREEQPMRQTFIPLLILPGWLVAVVAVCVGFYQQLYLGRPFGNNPMSDTMLLWTGILTILLLSGVVLLLLTSILSTEIWTDGIRYRFYPIMRKVQHIPLSEIESAVVTKYRPVMEFGGWGVRRRLLSRKTAYNISGNIGLRIIRKNGSQVLLGTRKKDELQRAVEKMKMPSAEKYQI